MESLSATGFLQAMVLLDDKDLTKYGDENVLTVWKNHVLGRNLKVALAELTLLGVDGVLYLHPGLSNHIAGANGKMFTLEYVGSSSN